MSGSDKDVRVNITAETGGFKDGAEASAQATTKLAQALTASGDAARQATISWRDLQAIYAGVEPSAGMVAQAVLKLSGAAGSSAQSLGGLANAMLGPAAAAAQAAVSFNALEPAVKGTDAEFKSATISAEFFMSKLNPTPLQLLRRLMGDELPAAFRMTQSATMDVVNAQTGLNIALGAVADSTGSATASAEVFARTLGLVVTPAQQLRDLMNVGVNPELKQTSIATAEVIDKLATESQSFKSAAESAQVFAQALGLVESPLQKLRTLMASTDQQTMLFGKDLASSSRGSLQFNQGIKSAGDSAAFFAEQLEGVQSPLQKLRSLMNDDEPQQRGAHGYSAITREVIVLGREAMTGDFSRIPGSLLALSERAGGLTTAIGSMVAGFSTFQLVGVGAIAAVTVALAAFVATAVHARTALDDVTAAAARMGRSTAEAAADASEVNAKLKELGGLTSSERQGIIQTGAAAVGMTREERKEWELLAPAIKAAYPGDEIKTRFEALMNAAKGGATAVREYLREAEALNESNLRDLAAAENDPLKAKAILLREATRILSGYNEARAQQIKDNENTMMAGAEGAMMPLPVSALPAPKLPQSFTAENPQAVQDFERTQKLLGPLHDRVSLEGEIVMLKAKQANSSGQELTDATNALKVAEGKLALMKDPGDAAWAARISTQAKEAGDAAVAAAFAQHATTRALNEAQTRAEIAVYQQALAEKGHADVEYNALRATLARLSSTLMKEESAGAVSAAKQALQAKLSALSEEQAANHDDFAKVMEIEQQKIALLRAAGATETRQLNEELAKQDNLRREHAQLQQQIAAEALAKAREGDASELNELKAVLEQRVAANQISKASELSTLRAFYDQQHALQMQAEQAYIDTLTVGTKAYQTALGVRDQLSASFNAKDQQYATQIYEQQKASWDKATAPIESAINGQVSSLLRGTETMGQAVNKMAANIVVSYAQMAAQAAQKWVASQLMQILWTGTAETAKTTTTAAGAAARNAIGTTETIAANNGLLIRLGRWIATELGFTGATSAQSAARVATQTAASAATLASAAPTNAAEAMSSAAVGAAAAGASVAAIPVVGWAMAPGVAAETYATLSGFATLASLDVGAWKLPGDMPANLHAGEMVVPANFADGLRGALGGGGGQGSGAATLNYSPKVSGTNREIAGMMQAQSRAMKSYLHHASRNGSLTAPTGRI